MRRRRPLDAPALGGGSEHRGIRDRIALEDARGLAQAERRNVRAEGVQAVGAELDEVDAFGAARECLNADRARPGEKLEHPRIGQIVAHHVEHRGADVLSRGADAPILGRDEIAAGEFSGYDSHELEGAYME